MILYYLPCNERELVTRIFDNKIQLLLLLLTVPENTNMYTNTVKKHLIQLFLAAKRDFKRDLSPCKMLKYIVVYD